MTTTAEKIVAIHARIDKLEQNNENIKHAIRVLRSALADIAKDVEPPEPKQLEAGSK